MALPALALMPYLEEDLAVLGIDAFEFGGSAMRRIALLAYRNGFLLPGSREALLGTINLAFNAYCSLTRPGHSFQDFTRAEPTRDEQALAIDREVLADEAPPSRT